MTRDNLDLKIRHLLDEILVMDSMVENAVIDSMDALKRRDLEAAQRVYTGDQEVNKKRFEIENECVIAIATQQPLARDLRIIASILEVAGELERMGDYAKGIAHICLMLGDLPPIKPLIDLPRMAEISVSMLHRAVRAFVDEDIDSARSIPQEDDVVDALYNQIYRELVTIMFSDPSTIDRANYLMWAAHNLERLADRVTNICERAIYIATGEMKEIDFSDDEFRREKP